MERFTRVLQHGNRKKIIKLSKEVEIEILTCAEVLNFSQMKDLQE